MIFIMLCTVSVYLSVSAERTKQEGAYWIFQWGFNVSIIFDNEITELVNIYTKLVLRNYMLLKTLLISKESQVFIKRILQLVRTDAETPMNDMSQVHSNIRHWWLADC